MEEGSSKGNSGKLFECQNSGCRLTFKYSSQLSRHKKICSKPPPNKKKFEMVQNRYVCVSCTKSYAHRPNLMRHLKSCNGKRSSKTNHVCPLCTKEFQYPSKLKRHMDQMHSEKALNRMCESSNFISRQDSQLRAHM